MLLHLDNTKRRAGGPCFQFENMNLQRAGGLHERAGCVVGTLFPKHNFKETLTKHPTLNYIYEAITSE